MEFQPIFTSLLALAFVLGLIGVVSLLLKRFGPEKFLYRVQRGAKQDTKQMAVKEVLTLDARRRLVRVARGPVEYVILLGANGEQVVETITPASIKSAKGKKA